MSTANAVTVALRGLREVTGPSLRPGGQGSLRWAAPPSGEILLLKQYKGEKTIPNSRDRLCRLIEWRRNLPSQDRAFLDARTAWIRHVVLDEDDLYGVLVPPAPEQFWFTNRKGVTKPREISELGHDQADAHRLARDYFSVPHVIARLGEVLRTLAWLHRKDIVLGDLHRANVLVGGLANAPAAYVIDCDAVVFKGEPVLCRTNFPYLWSHPMPTWPDPFDKSCDLAFFAHMTVGLVSKRLENIALTDDVLCHFPAAHGELLAQWLRRENAAARADTLSTVAVQWCRYVSDQGIEYVRSGTSEQRKPWKGVAAIPASPTGDIEIPKPLNPVKPTDRRLSPQLAQKSVLAEQVLTKRPCLGVAMIKVHFANTLCELATVLITVVMTAS